MLDQGMILGLAMRAESIRTNWFEFSPPSPALAKLLDEVAALAEAVDLGPALNLDNECALGSLNADCYELEQGQSWQALLAAVYDSAWRRGYASPIDIADGDETLALAVVPILAGDSAFEDDTGGSIEERWIYHEPGDAADNGIMPGDVANDARCGWRYEIGHAWYRRTLRAQGISAANRTWGDYANPPGYGTIDAEATIARKLSERATKAAATRRANKQLAEVTA